MLCPSCRAENEETARVCFACGTVLSALGPGTVLASRYEVLALLGRGGMGAVYRAYDRMLDEPVAVKVLRADVAGSPEMSRRFRSEIKLARRVSHWNVCRIFEYGEDRGLQFISMELVEGVNLKELLAQEGPLPPERAYTIALQVAEGLQAVHKVGIIHRDLKTPNIMVDARGAVRVMDFGIARPAASESATEGAAGYVMGSPEYMSPEQARGRPTDFRSDVYSLGIVIFETFTGRVPFRAETPVATLLMHLEQEPPLEGPEAAGIPPGLVPVLRRALAKDPAARYPSGAEVLDALRQAWPAALPAGGDTRPQPRRLADRGRRSAAVLLAVAAAVLLGAVAVPLLWQVLGPDVDRPAAEGPPSPSAPVTSTPVFPTVEPPPPESPAPSVRPAPHRPSPAVMSPATAAPEPSPPPAASMPTPSAPASPALTPAPTPAARPTVLPQTGALLVVVRPWADVSVDGVVIGQTPLRAIPLAAGPHSVVLTHPSYHPFPRKVTIRPGETFRLTVDLTQEGVRKQR